MDCFRGRRNQTNDNRFYSATVRKFALTMNYHSPAAFKFLREKFGNNLPCRSTFCNWMAESNLKCMPGILHEAIEALKGLVKEKGDATVSLSFDEINIRRHIQWIHASKRWSGFISHGSLSPDGTLPVANNILVFMVTVLDICVSIPVAYFAINQKLNADQKKVILLDVLKEISQIGVQVINITFDGARENISLCEKLGCSLDPDNLKTYFTNPLNQSKVFLIFDPCHMLKLIRNALGDLQYITDPQLGRIEWSYFEKLEQFRVKSKFITHKITKRHIQYYRNRMNVRLAAQTFSNGSTTSMLHLKDAGYSAFANCGATANLSLKINVLFDSMNTKKIDDRRIFKSALNENNCHEVFKFYDEMTPYLKTLKFNKKLCVESRRKTGFLGFLVNIVSIKQMYAEFVLSKKLKCLPIFYCSQDPLETFYSRLRGLNGCNDNPTMQQFQAAIRKLLFYNEVTASDFANCEDSLNILTISSARKSSDFAPPWEPLLNEDEGEDDEEEHGHFIARELFREVERNALNMTATEEASIAFFAGVIEKKIELSSFSCELCLNVFRQNEKIDGIFSQNNATQRPCKSTFEICKHTHVVFDKYKNAPNFNYDTILSAIKHAVDHENNLFENSDFSHELAHKRDFINAIIDEYVRMYGTYIARCLTLEQYQKLLRARNKRAVIFGGQ